MVKHKVQRQIKNLTTERHKIADQRDTLAVRYTSSPIQSKVKSSVFIHPLSHATLSLLHVRQHSWIWKWYTWEVHAQWQQKRYEHENIKICLPNWGMCLDYSVMLNFITLWNQLGLSNKFVTQATPQNAEACVFVLFWLGRCRTWESPEYQSNQIHISEIER